MAGVPWSGSGSTVNTAVKVDVIDPSSSEIAGFFAIQNLNSTYSIKISFDGGDNFITVSPFSAFSIGLVDMSDFYVKSATTDQACDFEWVCRDKEDT